MFYITYHFYISFSVWVFSSRFKIKDIYTKTESLFPNCALLHQSPYDPSLRVSFLVGFVAGCLREDHKNKNNHDPESKVSDQKRWQPEFTDCQQQLVMSLEKHVPDLANFKALAQLRKKY